MLIREGTQDALMYREVVVENEYGLPQRLGPQDVVVDVGAHIGCFALAALTRGAGRVVCLEPDPDNFRLLATNTKPYSDRVRLVQAACWGTPAPPEGLRLAQIARRLLGGVRATAMPTCVPGTGDAVGAVSLDDLLEELPPRVALLKLDCEGSEWPILFTSEGLARVERIVGELHPRLVRREWSDWDCTAQGARRRLESVGFVVSVGARGGRDPNLMLALDARRG